MVVTRKKSWLGLIFAVRASVLPRIWLRLLVTVGASIIVAALQTRWGIFNVSLTPLPFTLIGLALGIFLGFRNNTSYDRFWEGRKLWGGIVNTTRTLTRQTLTMLAADATARPSAEQTILVHRIIAYAHCLRLHLREQALTTDLAAHLSQEELESLARERNRPFALLQRLGDSFSAAWREGRVDTVHLATIESTLTELTNLQGGCERIKNTPIPFSYTVLIHQIVAFYCFALPFGIADSVGPMTPLVVALVGYAFFGLDAIGDELDDPFGTDPNDLPLSQITHSLEADLKERLGETDLPARPEPVGGLVH